MDAILESSKTDILGEGELEDLVALRLQVLVKPGQWVEAGPQLSFLVPIMATTWVSRCSIVIVEAIFHGQA